MEKRLFDDPFLSVVVPMYYEQEVARECHARLTAALKGIRHQIIYVNDGSKDQTLPILREIAAKDETVGVLSFSRNFGHQAAVSAGIAEARGDAIVIIDADLQDPPELIPDMLALWQQGYDVVYAQREQRKGESAFKLLTAKAFYKVLDALTDVNIPRDTGDFRLIDRKVADAFLQMPEHSRFIRGMIPWLGFEATPIHYVRDERYAGVTKYPLKKMLKLAGDGIYSFSFKPLKLITGLGILSVVLGLCALICLLIIFCINHTVPSWLPVVSAVVLMGGIQLLSLGIVSEYIARIYDQSRARPLYVVKEKINL